MFKGILKHKSDPVTKNDAKKKMQERKQKVRERRKQKPSKPGKDPLFQDVEKRLLGVYEFGQGPQAEEATSLASLQSKWSPMETPVSAEEHNAAAKPDKSGRDSGPAPLSDGSPKDSPSSNGSASDSIGNTPNDNGQSRRRRRSSAQSISLNQKVHKRKLKYLSERPCIAYANDAKAQNSISAYQGLLLKIVQGRGGALTPLFSVPTTKKFSKIMNIFIPGLYQSDFALLNDTDSNGGLRGLDSEAKEGPQKFFAETFQYMIPTMMPGGNGKIISPLTALILCRLSKKDKKERKKELKGVKLVLYDLLLTKEQMVANNYPLHSEMEVSEENELTPGWAETQAFEHEGSKTFSLDCEFCLSATGKVLTRVSLVNFQGEVVLDEYVKPEEPITNYLTKYSGITEEIMADATTTFEEARDNILSTVSSLDILIGHSLESDLNGLKLRHPRVIDTAILFEHHLGGTVKHSLKHLLNIYLDRVIQKGEQSGEGHSSVEDLRACLDLVKRKLIEGPDFGKIVGQSLFRQISATAPGTQSIVIDRLKASYGSLLDDVKEPDFEFTCIDDCDAAVEHSIANMEDKYLQLVCFRQLELDSQLEDFDRSIALEKLSQRLERLYASMPRDAFLFVFTDGGDTTEMKQLQSIKRLFNKRMNEGVDISTLDKTEEWDFEKLTALHEATELARQGMSFVAVKP